MQMKIPHQNQKKKDNLRKSTELQDTKETKEKDGRSATKSPDKEISKSDSPVLELKHELPVLTRTNSSEKVKPPVPQKPIPGKPSPPPKPQTPENATPLPPPKSTKPTDD